MNFNQYECRGGIAVPVNEFDETANYRTMDGTKICPYEQFQTWLQSQPTIHCDSELSGIYPVGEFKAPVWQNRLEYNHCDDPTDYEWTSENENAYRRFKTFSEYETHGKSLGFETRLFIEYTGAKQPVNDDDALIIECGKNCSCKSKKECWAPVLFNEPATHEQKGVEQARLHQWISVGIKMPEIDSMIVIWNLFFNEEMMICFDDKNMLKQFKHWYPTLGEPK